MLGLNLYYLISKLDTNEYKVALYSPNVNKAGNIGRLSVLILIIESQFRIWILFTKCEECSKANYEVCIGVRSENFLPPKCIKANFVNCYRYLVSYLIQLSCKLFSFTRTRDVRATPNSTRIATWLLQAGTRFAGFLAIDFSINLPAIYLLHRWTVAETCSQKIFDQCDHGRTIVKTAHKDQLSHNSRKKGRRAGHGAVRHPLSKGGCGLSLLEQRVGWSTWAVPCPQTDCTRLSNANIVSEIVRRRDKSGWWILRP